MDEKMKHVNQVGNMAPQCTMQSDIMDREGDCEYERVVCLVTATAQWEMPIAWNVLWNTRVCCSSPSVVILVS